MISYMTERIKITVRPANIQISFYMNPDKTEYLLYTEGVQVVTNVRRYCFTCTKKKYLLCGQVIFFGFGIHCLFKNMRINLVLNGNFTFPELTTIVGCFLIFCCTLVAFIANNMDPYQTAPNIFFASMFKVIIE